MSKELIKNLIDEDIDVLRESLTHLQKMDTKGMDNTHSAFLRKCREEFIEDTKNEIDWMLNFRKSISPLQA